MIINFFARIFRFNFLAVLTIMICLIISGCAPIFNIAFRNSLPPMEGEQIVPGLHQKVTVRRDNMGIPLIEAASMEDLIFAMGYVSAYDRFTQMEGFRLVGKARLSELLGKATLEMDIYLRALNLKKVADTLYKSASPELHKMLQIYSDGVNAYLANSPLPLMLKMSGYKPEPWEPIDSVYVFIVLTLGLGQNLHDEINMLNIAQKIEPEKMAWLFPIYPDEPLPFKEMKKLTGLDLKTAANDIEKLSKVISATNRILIPETAASNNWVVSGKITKSGKPIFANDTHLPLTMPSIWHMMHLKCPGIQGAGIAIAGVPGIIAGYNGHVAIGMTMVMADNQDIFLEKLQQKPDGLYYLYKDKWLKATSREEKFRMKGQSDVVSRTFYETRHGVLLNNILTDEPRHILVPMPVNQSLGIALSWAGKEPDRTMDAFFNTMRARSVDEVLQYISHDTSVIPLNMVMADNKDIAWQVTGRYPIRKKGRGLCPSPGWTGEYDWKGFLNPSLHPSAKNPKKGYIGTANHRTVPADFPYTLSSSWYYPDRAQRIDQMLKGVKDYTMENAKAMQLDIKSPFVEVIKSALLDKKTLQKMRAVWQKSEKHQSAEKAIALLKDFDGNMRMDSAGAAFCGAFLFSLSKNLFADELGGTDSLAYKSLLETFLLAYSSLHDHLTERGKKSPFWDDVTTPEKEERHQILAQTVLDAIDLLNKQCGKNPEKWQWGKLHTYHWKTDATLFSDYMGFFDRIGVKFLSGYLDRGPYPAPGDHTTLNVTAYHPGKDFDVWLIPAMRIIVDFGSDEPLIGINSTGQSDNPSSPYYDDGITAFREGKYQDFPFKEDLAEAHYTKTLTLLPRK
ncbi:MAG: penicillin acylase family protein [Syntrophaceae bacterium]|nr:penicillin acylase family protein [Syntrophaceae bacterium]